MVLRPGEKRPTPGSPSPTTTTSSSTPYTREQYIHNVPSQQQYQPSKYQTVMGPWPLEPGETKEHYQQRISDTLPPDLSEDKQKISEMIRTLEIQPSTNKYQVGNKTLTRDETIAYLKTQLQQITSVISQQAFIEEYYSNLRSYGFRIYRSSSGEIIIEAPSDMHEEEIMYYKTLSLPKDTVFKDAEGNPISKEEAVEIMEKRYNIWLRGKSSSASLNPIWGWERGMLTSAFDAFIQSLEYHWAKLTNASPEKIQKELEEAQDSIEARENLAGAILVEYDNLVAENASWDKWAVFFSEEITTAATIVLPFAISKVATIVTPGLTSWAASKGISAVGAHKIGTIIKAVTLVAFGTPVALTAIRATQMYIESVEEMEELEKLKKENKISHTEYRTRKKQILQKLYISTGTLLNIGLFILIAYASSKLGQISGTKYLKKPRIHVTGTEKGGTQTLTAQKYTFRLGKHTFGKYGQKATISKYSPYKPKLLQSNPYKPKLLTEGKGTPWSEVKSQFQTPKEPYNPTWYKEKPWYAPEKAPLKPTTDLYPSYEDFGTKLQLAPKTAPKPSRFVSTAYAEPKAKIIPAFGTQTEVTTMPVTKTLTSIKTEPLMWTKVYAKPITQTQTLVSPWLITSTQTQTLTKTQTLTDTLTETETKTKTLPLVLTLPLTKTKTKTLTQTLPQTQTLTQTMPLTLTKTQTQTKTKTKVLPLIRRKTELTHLKPTQGYHTYVKAKGKHVKITPKPLPRRQALGKGAHYVDNTPSRTFYIKPAKKSTPVGSEPLYNQTFAIKRHKFRPYNIRKRQKIGMGNNKWIEKNTYLIDTPGEIQGITVKGLMKLEKMRSLGYKPIKTTKKVTYTKIWKNPKELNRRTRK